MQFLLVGQGRLIIGYDRGGTYDHPDPAYGVKILSKTLRGYEIGRYVRMEIARDGEGRGVLRGLQISDGPQGALGPLRGPGDFEVRQLTVEGPHMKVVTAWKDVTLTPSPVTERSRDPGWPARLAARGCPVQGAWTKATPSAAW